VAQAPSPYLENLIVPDIKTNKQITRSACMLPTFFSVTQLLSISLHEQKKHMRAYTELRITVLEDMK
jgi:hypothetical protein